jgi:SAM-dependent methyltransferase
MMTSTTWQLAQDAAVRYEEVLVPWIIGPFALALVKYAQIQTGEIVLDVGCGTGAATFPAARFAGTSGRVFAVDINPATLTVAQTQTNQGAPIEWLEGSAFTLPLDPETVDVVLCSQALSFFEDKQLALNEMDRMTRPTGRVALSAWCALEDNPYFQALVDSIDQHLGADVAAGLRAAFRLSQRDELLALMDAAGFQNVDIITLHLDLVLPPFDDFIPKHIRATPMLDDFDAADAAVQALIVQDVAARLGVKETNKVSVAPFKSFLAKGYG